MSPSLGTSPSGQNFHLLAGDIGGTKAHLAIFKAITGPVGYELIEVHDQKYASQDYPGLGAILRVFLDDARKIAPHPILAACFGVPGFVSKNAVKPTNLSWSVDGDELAKEFGFGSATIINDLMANALGIAELRPSDFEILAEGAEGTVGNRAVISPGTGLGEAGLFWDGKRHHPWASEGGHTDFAPRNPTEIALLEYLLKRFGRVSVERVCCGLGIENIYLFLRDTGRGKEKPEIAEEIRQGDFAGTVSRHADAGDCALCAQTMEIFVSCLGAEAGNLALKTMAAGGVYLGGGIPKKILHRLHGKSFLSAFHDKGRLAPLMHTMPVHVILNDEAALLGAARCALDHAAPVLSSIPTE